MIWAHHTGRGILSDYLGKVRRLVTSIRAEAALPPNNEEKALPCPAAVVNSSIEEARASDVDADNEAYGGFALKA